MALTAYMPHMMSAMPTPTLIGSPSGSPVSDMIPPMPWAR